MRPGDGNVLRTSNNLHRTLSAVRPSTALPEAVRKKKVTALLDPDVIEALKEGGKGWQTRMNDMLRRGLELGERPKE